MDPVYNLFVYVLWFLATFYTVFFIVSMIFNKNKLYEKRVSNVDNGYVSVIVSAFNEEKKIDKTIRSLKKIKYEKIEFIIVNDGSSDRTADVVRKNIFQDKRFILIDRKNNIGKAASLNEGISIAKGVYVACMDADSMVEPDVFTKALPYFNGKRVGAVTISVEVFKPRKFLHKLIDIEYTIGLSLFLKIASFFNFIFVTPGPFSIYRMDVLKKIKGFDSENIVEDLEIAYRIHKAGYRIENCMEAKVWTICPPTFHQIYNQRKRWYSGALQTCYKHRSLMLKRKYGLFSFTVPFNYLLVLLGLVLFISSLYLGVSHIITNLFHLQYTSVSLWDRIMNFKIDILSMSTVSFIGMSAFFLSILVIVFGMKMSRKKLMKKKTGIVFFPLMFFLYQIFWIGSVIAVIRGKKVKWR